MLVLTHPDYYPVNVEILFLCGFKINISGLDKISQFGLFFVEFPKIFKLTNILIFTFYYYVERPK